MSTGYGRKSKITEEILDNRREVTVYRKEFNKLTGDAKASLLLNQFIYWDKIQGGGEFYKFIEPPSTPRKQYHKGDSWTEELGFTRREFDTAIKKIGYKRGKTKNKFDNEEDAYIIYYTAYNLTHWFINWDKLNRDLINLYYAQAYSFADDLFRKPASNSGDNDLFNIMLITKGFTQCNLLRKLPNVRYYYSEITTEITTERSTYKGNNSSGSNSGKVETFSFTNKKVKDLINKKENSKLIKNNIFKYITKYAVETGDDHPRLKLSQWQQVVDNILFESERFGLIAKEYFNQVLDQHFNTDYNNGNCDYNILHFISGRNIQNRVYEVADELEEVPAP